MLTAGHFAEAKGLATLSYVPHTHTCLLLSSILTIITSHNCSTPRRVVEAGKRSLQPFGNDLQISATPSRPQISPLLVRLW